MPEMEQWSLLDLTPEIIDKLTGKGVFISSIWPERSDPPDGRADALAATDCALTLRQPIGTTIEMRAYHSVEWERAKAVLDARGFLHHETSSVEVPWNRYGVWRPPTLDDPGTDDPGTLVAEVPPKYRGHRSVVINISRRGIMWGLKDQP